MYAELVDEFHRLTDHRWPDTGLCCLDVDEHGAPKCCYQVVNGAPLWFTSQELVALWRERLVPTVFWRQHDDNGQWDVDRAYHKPAEIRGWMRDGWISRTIECAAHPTRPIVKNGIVLGVVCVPDCNTELAIGSYHKERDNLLDLWQTAVRMYGEKPYYVQSHDLRRDLLFI